MPTFKVLVGKEKEDKTFNVYIQLTHQRKKKYLPTGHYVTKRQLSKGNIKDEYVLAACNNIVVGYRDKLLKLQNINSTPIEDIKSYLLEKDTPDAIDFISFGQKFITTQNKSTGKNTEYALNTLTDYLGTDRLNINDLNLKVLTGFAAYLKTERIRMIGKVQKVLQPVPDTGVRDYIGKLRQIFLAARNEYNDEVTGKMVIPHYPFAKFKVPKAAKAKKRNVQVEVIKTIRDAGDFSKRSDLGRDVFMLSFYLIGTNTVDLFNVKEFKNGRLIYYRTKTESRKGENALISIKVEPEVVPLLGKYKDHTGKRVFNFYQQYANADGFSSAVNKGLKALAVNNNIKESLTSYYARHSWATIARNACKVSKDGIHLALNHADNSMKITDLYLEEDYSLIDEANRKVLDTLL